MPRSLGQEKAERTRAEKSGNLDAYLESVGAGDALSPGYAVRENPWKNSTTHQPDTVDGKGRRD